MKAYQQQAIKLANDIFKENPEILELPNRRTRITKKCLGGYWLPPDWCFSPRPECSGCGDCKYYKGKGG